MGVVYGIKHGYPRIWKGWLQKATVRMAERLEEDDVVKRALARPNNEGGFASNELLQAFMWMTGRIEIEDKMMG